MMNHPHQRFGPTANGGVGGVGGGVPAGVGGNNTNQLTQSYQQQYRAAALAAAGGGSSSSSSSSSSWFVGAPVSKVLVAFIFVFYMLVHNGVFPNSYGGSSSSSSSSASMSNEYRQKYHVNAAIEFNAIKILQQKYEQEKKRRRQQQLTGQHQQLPHLPPQDSTSPKNNKNNLERDSNYEYFSLSPSPSFLVSFFPMTMNYRYITSKCTFGSTSELVVGTALLAFLSIKYEREMSSRKFFVYVVFTTMVSILLEYIILQGFLTNLFQSQYYYLINYTGPYCLLGSLFTLFHKFSPRLHPKFFSLGLGGLYFSEKSFYYLWFFYVISNGASSSSSSGAASNSIDWYNTIAPAIIGMISSLFYLSLPTPFLQSAVLDVPEVLVRLVRPITSQLADVPPPPLVPFMIGVGNTGAVNPLAAAAAAAGSEVHSRRQHAQRNHNSNIQQLIPGLNSSGGLTPSMMMRNHLHQNISNSNNNGNNSTATMMGNTAHNFLQEHSGDGGISALAAAIEPDPEAIEQLTAMGFERNDVIEALKYCQNNVQHAADRLLLRQ